MTILKEVYEQIKILAEAYSLLNNGVGGLNESDTEFLSKKTQKIILDEIERLIEKSKKDQTLTN